MINSAWGGTGDSLAEYSSPAKSVGDRGHEPKFVMSRILNTNNLEQNSISILTSSSSPLTTMSNIPAYVQTHLPSKNVSINNFLTILIPPYVSIPPRLTRIDKFVSDKPANFDHINPSELLSPPPEIVRSLKSCVELDNGSITSVLCPHLSAGGAHYPLWVIWAELLTARGIQENWRRAVCQLESQMHATSTNYLLQHAANTLSHLPWTGNLCGYRDTIDICHLWVFFTQEWSSLPCPTYSWRNSSGNYASAIVY